MWGPAWQLICRPMLALHPRNALKEPDSRRHCKVRLGGELRYERCGGVAAPAGLGAVGGPLQLVIVTLRAV